MIVGGGFAGLLAARGPARAPVRITSSVRAREQLERLGVEVSTGSR